MPRLAFGALALRPQGSGVQTYQRELLRALRAATSADLVAYVQRAAVGELPAGVTPVVRPDADGARRALHALRRAPGADLVHGLDVDLPARPGMPCVTTVHDTSVVDVPWAHSRGRAAAERLLLRRAVSRADLVLAVSSFTAERVQSLYGRSALVTPLAAGPGFAPPPPEQVEQVVHRHGLPASWVLHVGTVEPRKDLGLLAAACRRVDVPLVLVGLVPDPSAVPAGARHLGYVPVEDLPALYAGATVVAYPSRYEGFGLPPVEAMASGGVVLASRVGALPESLGDGAVLVPPRDEEALTGALKDLLADPGRRADLRAAGQRRAGELSWDRTAALTLQGYRSLGLAV